MTLSLEFVAEPADGTIETTGVPGVQTALCRNCEEAIWRGDGWDWEHFDNEEQACEEEEGPLPSDRSDAKVDDNQPNPGEESNHEA